MDNRNEEHKQENDDEHKQEDTADNLSMIYAHPLLTEDMYDNEPRQQILMESGVSFLDEDTIRSLIENHNLTLSQFLRQTAFDEDWEEEDGEDDIEIDPCFQNLSPTLARRMQMTMDTLVSAIALVSVEEEMDNTASGSVSRFHSDHSNDDTTDAHEYTDEPFIKQ